MPDTHKCIVCGGALVVGLDRWHRVCRRCGYEGSSLQPAINESRIHETFDELGRISGLRHLRRENGKLLIDLLQLHVGSANSRPRLLDVGCSHGWFLEMATLHFVSQGLEPHMAVAAQAKARGLPVRCGYFPEALEVGERFDVIVLNDVIEHIPDVHAALVAAHAHLSTRGLLLLSVPNSSGIYYRIAKSLRRVAIHGPLRRMWQFGFPSPHMHYFNACNLPMLLERHGFTVEHVTTFKAVTHAGLWQRIRHVPGGLGSAVAVYLLVSALSPILNWFERDSLVCLARRLGDMP